MRKTKTVQPAGTQLAAARVERQLPVDCDPFAALDESPAFTGLAKTQSFEPQNGLKTEPIVQLHRIDVLGFEVGVLPEVSACGHAGHDLRLVPTRPLTRT